MTEAEAMMIYRRFIRLVETSLRDGSTKYVTEEINEAVRRLGGINSPLAEICYETTLSELEDEGYRFCKGCKVQLDSHYYLNTCVACKGKL